MIPNSKNEKKSAITSVVLHLLLLLFLLIPIMNYQDPPPGQKAVLVSFGEPEVSNGDMIASSHENDASSQSEKPQKIVLKANFKKTNKKNPVEVKHEAVDSRKVKISQDPGAISLERKRIREEKAEAKRLAADLEAKKAAEVEAKRISEEKARKKAEYEAAKRQYGDLFGTGKENSSNTGNQGNPVGDPDKSALEGIAKGLAKIGGGLGTRKILYEPKIIENSQKRGKVVIKLCVDRFGNVIDPKFTQRGSTTTDSYLIKVALANVRKYKFSQSEIDKQCGSITIDFKVK